MKTLSTTLHEDGIFHICIDVPGESMNVLNRDVLEEFSPLLTEIENDSAIKAVVISSAKPGCFIAGADIKLLQAATTAEEAQAISQEAQQLFGKITVSPVPFVAAIDGVCLGGGYEFALACDYRIASDAKATQLGLPEVMLGLLPGATGTTLLPRKIALMAALDLLLTGKQVAAKKALKLGLVDEVVPATILQECALKTARRLSNKNIPEPKAKLLDRLMRLPLASNLVLKKARAQVMAKTRGLYPAPLAILDVVQQSLSQPLDKALTFEAKKFGELAVSAEAKQLINIYFATTTLKKETFGVDDAQPAKVEKLGVLGGGLMGGGIATISIDKAGTATRIKDINEKGILGAYKHLGSYYQNKVKRKALSQEQAKKKISLLTGSLTYDGFKSCDLMIEAVFESLDLKHKMVADIEALGNERTIFASNTSSIPITQIAEKAQRPQNIIGMHYFSPVEKMPLLEIITHPNTSAETLATAVKFGRRQGKTVIVVKDGAGFYVNRILAPYIGAAMEMAMEGVKIDSIDKALLDFGFPVGPFKLLDEVGLDVVSKVQPILEAEFGNRMQTPDCQQRLLDDQRLGKKAGKGFYLYDKGKSANQVDESVYTVMQTAPAKTMDSNLIVQRCVYSLLNEACLCLQEGVIEKAMHGDIGAIFGIGFPPPKGGPFRHIDTMGVEAFVSQLNELESNYGAKYKAANLLMEMASANKTFYQQ